jgi:hypothetical protein
MIPSGVEIFLGLSPIDLRCYAESIVMQSQRAASRTAGITGCSWVDQLRIIVRTFSGACRRRKGPHAYRLHLIAPLRI